MTAHYIDIQNKENSVETFTLNKDEARDRGNIDYVGYYFFDNIRALPGTNIIIDIDQTNHNLIIPSQPGYTIRVTTFSLNIDFGLGDNFQEVPNKTESNPDLTKLLNNTNADIVEIKRDDKNNVLNSSKKNIAFIKLFKEKVFTSFLGLFF